jgi:hypothetical protein
LEAIDQVHTVLQKRINEVLRLDIWRHVSRGSLSVNVEGRRMKRARGGAQEVETFLDGQQLSVFPGFQMFSPKISRLASRITGCAKRLSLIDFGAVLFPGQTANIPRRCVRLAEHSDQRPQF